MESYGSAESKSFGVRGFFNFMAPRLWTNGCWGKFIVCVNMFNTVVLKLITVAAPILFKETVDSILCDSKTVDVKRHWLIKVNQSDKCPSEAEINVLIGLYVIFKFLVEAIKATREIPYANMAARAEISITHDV